MQSIVGSGASTSSKPGGPASLTNGVAISDFDSHGSEDSQIGDKLEALDGSDTELPPLDSDFEEDDDEDAGHLDELQGQQVDAAVLQWVAQV